jgi:hypothetical protein
MFAFWGKIPSGALSATTGDELLRLSDDSVMEGLPQALATNFDALKRSISL